MFLTTFRSPDNMSSSPSPPPAHLKPPPLSSLRSQCLEHLFFRPTPLTLRLPSQENQPRTPLPVRSHHNPPGNAPDPPELYCPYAARRRGLVLVPLVALGASLLRPFAAGAEERTTDSPAVAEEKRESAVSSRVYDTTAIGEPQAVGKDRRRVWEKLMSARVVYLGEAEQVPVRDDKVLELEIVRNLKSMCTEQQRSVSVALVAFPCDLQAQLDKFVDGMIDGKSLQSYTTHWTPDHWLEYEPLLNYCRDCGIRLVACGTPLQVLRTVQAEGIHGLSKTERKIYTPPAGSGFIAGFTSISGRSPIDMISANQSNFGPSSYLSAQARVVEDYTMSQMLMQAILEGESSGMLIVITGASHVIYGSRGIGVPARISKKLQKKNQVVILLNPERQDIRREGEVPIADFLWYTAARPCNRNCFDRAEIARVMNAAGRRREALPQDLQKGLDLGLVSPEVLQSFFDLEQYPLIAELTHQFQGFRERLLADPKFLHRLAIEETISITTTLLAQYERRKGNFFEELDYVITDTLRGSVVDFFTVWLPAPTLSFFSYDEKMVPENFELLKGLLGSIPDNAFQMSTVGKDWTLVHRLGALLFGGVKLAGVGFISSIGAVAASNFLYTVRRLLFSGSVVNGKHKRSPLLRTAAVYGCFLGTSANLRYQVIAGLVEHRLSDQFLSSNPLLMNLISFFVRTINSYWGTQQWVDLARYTGIQTQKSVSSNYHLSETTSSAALDFNAVKEASMDDVDNS